MSRRKNFKFEGGRNASVVLDDGGTRPGIVLVREGEDKPLDPGATIDLREEPKAADGTPHFRTRPADPMRAFTTPVRADMGMNTKELGKIPTALICDSTAISRRASLTSELDQLRSIKDAIQQDAGAARPDPLRPFREAQKPPEFVSGEFGEHNAFQSALDKLNPFRKDRAFSALGAKLPPAPKVDLKRLDGLQADQLKELAAITTDPKLGRVQDSAFHKIVSGWRDGSVAIPIYSDGTPFVERDGYQRIAEALLHLSPDAGIFLLQHDWSGAFSKAVDFEGGEVRLPYHLTVVECMVNGHRVVLALMPEDGESGKPPLALLHYSSAVKVGQYVFAGAFEFDPRTWKLIQARAFEGLDPLIEKLLAQVRAVFIALEAEVAASEIIRAPHKLNAKRERQGKMPLYDYHIVSLAARKRYAARLPEPGDQDVERRHVRLHFVRGHWRHYENHKVFIKWHMRGDPDLGFIDKEYRL